MSRTRKAHVVIHCNLPPQSTTGLYNPPEGEAAVLNTVTTSIVLTLPLSYFYAYKHDTIFTLNNAWLGGPQY